VTTNYLTLRISAILLPLLLNACAGGAQKVETDPDAEQMVSISLWHECVDNSLTELTANATYSNPESRIQHTLIACQGHKQDVLDTFPRRLHASLDKILVKQAHESGYSMYAKHSGLAMPISPVTLDRLKRRSFKP